VAEVGHHVRTERVPGPRNATPRNIHGRTHTPRSPSLSQLSSVWAWWFCAWSYHRALRAHPLQRRLSLSRPASYDISRLRYRHCARWTRRRSRPLGRLLMMNGLTVTEQDSSPRRASFGPESFDRWDTAGNALAAATARTIRAAAAARIASPPRSYTHTRLTRRSNSHPSAASTSRGRNLEGHR
jgi:hypothetical protein